MTTLEAADGPFRLTAPIDHITKLDDGTLVVHTVATDETPDSQGEIVDYDAAKAAAPDLMKWATLGEMHDPGRMDAGTILRLHFDDDRRQITADLHVVDPVAVRKVLSRTYKAVSIGGTKLSVRPVEIAGRVFRKITRLLWDEISLVNRGANPNALIAKQFVLAKRAQETEMPDMDAGTASPLGEPATAAPESRTEQQAAADAAREAIAKAGEPAAPFPGAAAPFKAKKAARKAAKAAKAAPPAAAPEPPAAAAEDEPDGDEAPAPDAAKAEKKMTKAQRLAKKVKALRKANRELAKAKKRLAKRATPRVMLRTLAKAGARNSQADRKLIEQGHDVMLKLGYAKCMAKANGLAAPEPTGSAEAPIAKSETAEIIPTTMREALAGILPTAVLDAMQARLTAIDERSKAQGDQLAKIAKSPTGGGPATSYAAVFRGSAESSDPASVLEKAAAVIDDPRLKEQVGSAAAAEMIRQARKG